MDIQALTALAAKIYGFIKPVIKSELGAGYRRRFQGGDQRLHA